jgi:hypothetical protein
LEDVRNDIDDPSSNVVMTELDDRNASVGGEHRALLKTETLLPQRAMLLKLKEEPRASIPKTEALEPSFTRPRTDSELATSTNPTTEVKVPSGPRTMNCLRVVPPQKPRLNPLPSLPNCRNDNALPKCTVSSTLNRDPNLTEERTENVDPIWNESMTDIV